MKMRHTPVMGELACDDNHAYVRRRSPKLSRELIKGISAELRALRILRTLSKTTPWLRRARLTGARHDGDGFDIIAHLRREHGGNHTRVRVPLQVKSSFGGRLAWERSYDAHTVATVPCVVVNETYSDDELALLLYLTLDKVLQSGSTYEQLLRRTKAEVLQDNKNPTRRRILEAVQRRRKRKDFVAWHPKGYPR